MGNALLAKYEIMLHWLAMTAYLAATLCFFRGTIFGKNKSLACGMTFILAGLLPQTLALLVRWSYVFHGPYLTRYEVLSSSALVMLGQFLYLSRRHPEIRFSGLFVAPLALFATLAALCSGTAVRMLPASFNSLWVLPHVFFTKLAVGAFCIVIALIVAYLLKGRRSQARFMATLPAAELLDDYIYKITAFAFCCWTITIATGALWAHESWERYWGWDPIETWSLITWLLLGVYLHLRRFFGWKGKRGIAVLIICIAVSLLTVFFLPFLVDSLHGDYYR